VVAADVLIYVGDVSAVLDGVARILRPGGLFAFSVERSSTGEDLQLLPSLRYAHGESALRRMAAARRLAVQTLREAPIRYERRKPVLGMYVVLRSAAAQ
jgi:predicted TPR repeat methyltransferase